MTVTTLVYKKICEILRYQDNTQDNVIALHEPTFNGNEWHYVKECIDTGWISSAGKFVDKFEKDLCDYTGATYAIATVNGTAALHMAYLLAGIKSGMEVLVPTLTFVGTINPLMYLNAIPHFIDSDETSLGINSEILDKYLADITVQKDNQCINKITGRQIKALCVMHTLGHPVDLEAMEEICKKYHLELIEDAAEALGSFYKNKHVGHHGKVGALSFNGNKILTTGGGGAILTNDQHLAKLAKHLTTTAKLPHLWEYEHDQVGYNYRLPNINAAIGCAQLEKISEFLNKKRKLAEKYASILSTIDEVQLITEPHYAKSNYWLNAMVLNKNLSNYHDNDNNKNDILKLLCEHKIMVRPLWNLQHTLKMFKDSPCMPTPIAESLSKRLIKLPSSPHLIDHHYA